jgi:hypothetical protein
MGAKISGYAEISLIEYMKPQEIACYSLSYFTSYSYHTPKCILGDNLIRTDRAICKSA